MAKNTIHRLPRELNRNRHEMSDWTYVTSKKKPPSVEAVELPDDSSPSAAPSAETLTTHLRAEFYVHAGSKQFNPATALRGLFQAIQHQFPLLHLYSVDGNTSYSTPDNLPTDLTQFEHHFQVIPHLGRFGGGQDPRPFPSSL